LGRRDSLQAFFALANTNLPAPFFTLPQLKASFQNVGLDRPSDLVALSGNKLLRDILNKFKYFIVNVSLILVRWSHIW